MEVKILGDSVMLGVDGEEVLHLRQVSGPLASKPQPIMRIALGGLLFPASKLRLPVTASQGQEPRPKLVKHCWLDGCGGLSPHFKEGGWGESCMGEAKCLRLGGE